MAKRLKDAFEVIEYLGGTVRVARQFGVDPSAVSGWKQRNRMPSKNLTAMQKMLQRKKAKASASLWGQG